MTGTDLLSRMRAIFITYSLFIVTGIALFVVLGLTHQ